MRQCNPGLAQNGMSGLVLVAPLLLALGARPPRRRRGPGSRLLSVLLADSISTYRAGLRQALERKHGVRVVAEAENAEAVLVCGRDLQVGLAVIDVDLPPEGGIEVCRQLISEQPGLPVVIISHWDWDVYLFAAHAAGAAGFLLKQMPTRDLVAAIQEAATRPIYTAEQVQRLQKWALDVGRRLTSLGKREWDVLWQLAAGHSNREIAQALTLSENTVEKYVSAILHKLQVTSRSGLISFVHEHHLEALNTSWIMAEIRQ